MYRHDLAMQRFYVLIADDNEKVRSSLVELLDPAFDVIGVVDNGKELMEAARVLRPDVIVTSMTMPQMDGLGAREKLLADGQALPFVFVSDFGKEVVCLLPNEFEVDEEPPVGLVYKKELSLHLLRAVEAVLAGRPYISPYYRD